LKNSTPGSQVEFKGLFGRDYHYTRRNFPTVRFSLQCRINATSHGISKLFPSGVDRLLDLGSADGLLAKGINTLVPNINHIYALDRDRNLLKYNPFPSIQGDCCRLPFADHTFEVITATALIEHLHEPDLLLTECCRVLKPAGALLLTSPSPFFEWVAAKIGYLRNSGHVARYSLRELEELCKNAGFEIVISRKFQVSPFYLPAHNFLEAALRRLGLSFLMMNQLIGCIKEK
jgi:SAM-dependent methyltransferase